MKPLRAALAVQAAGLVSPPAAAAYLGLVSVLSGRPCTSRGCALALVAAFFIALIVFLLPLVFIVACARAESLRSDQLATLVILDLALLGMAGILTAGYRNLPPALVLAPLVLVPTLITAGLGAWEWRKAG